MHYVKTISEVLRVDDDGIIKQYDINLEKWRDADDGMSGIYSGNVECDAISEKEVNIIIDRWLAVKIINKLNTKYKDNTEAMELIKKAEEDIEYIKSQVTLDEYNGKTPYMHALYLESYLHDWY